MTRRMIIALFASLAALSGCQSVGLGNLPPTGESIKGEIQWDFAAGQGDVVVLAMRDLNGILVAQEIQPSPGSKHVPFDLVVANADLKRCHQNNACHYDVSLRRNGQIKAQGEMFYSAVSKPVLRLQTVGLTPGGGVPLPKPVS